MKIKPQTGADLVTLGKLIESISVAVMTKPDLHGNLVSRPLIPLEMDTNGAFWFFVDQRSVSTERLRNINITFSDPVRALCVSLSGTGEVLSDPDHAASMWMPVMKAWFPDGPTDSAHLALMKFVPKKALYWDGPTSRKHQLF